MFAVIQFIENSKFQVLAVPVSWIKGGILQWPKISNDKIESLRVNGLEFHGSTKRIPIIIWKKLRSFEAAEKAADELAMKEVSDVEGKKKRLKPQKQPAPGKSTDYNLMFAALQKTSVENQSASSTRSGAAPSGINSDTVLSKAATGNVNLFKQPVAIRASQQAESQILLAQNSTAPSKDQKDSVAVAPPKLTSNCSNNPANLSRRMLLEPQVAQLKSPQQITTQQPLVQGRGTPNTVMASTCAPFNFEHNSVSSVLTPIHQPIPKLFSEAAINAMPIETLSTHEVHQQSNTMYCNTDEIIYLTQREANQAHLGNHLITDTAGTIRYDELKRDLQTFIRTTVEDVVKECFQEHFSRLAALTEMNSKASSKAVPTVMDDPVENHARIDNEIQLHEWNVKLGNEDLCAQYLVYFARIIPPNSYVNNGDNACYTIVDCLFTRDFWTRFTWTGISRGQKCKRGFREFGNVLQPVL